MPRLTHRLPKYRKHKKSKQAVVTLDGKDLYLGPFGTQASRNEYDRVIQEYITNGRRLAAPVERVLVCEIIVAFRRFARDYYRNADGTLSGEVTNFDDAFQPLRKLYGNVAAVEFGPLALKAVRQQMIDSGWCRNTVNRHVGRIKHVFRWAVENEMIPPAVHQALDAVAGVRAGRMGIRESEPVLPVPEAMVEATLPFLPPTVATMVKVQELLACRPGEACKMRGTDIDMSGAIWLYRPATHKTAWHGHERVIQIGPQAQELLKPFLKPDVTAYLFSPADAEADRHRRQRAARRSKVTPSQQARAKCAAARPRPRPPRDRYDDDSYRRAVARACDMAFPPPAPLTRLDGETAAAWQRRLTAEQREQLAKWQREHRWHPHQLRHAAATKLRKLCNGREDVVQTILGHKRMNATQAYGLRDMQAARAVVAQVG